jgi:hypothetical protein
MTAINADYTGLFVRGRGGAAASKIFPTRTLGFDLHEPLQFKVRALTLHRLVHGLFRKMRREQFDKRIHIAAQVSPAA